METVTEEKINVDLLVGLAKALRYDSDAYCTVGVCLALLRAKPKLASLVEALETGSNEGITAAQVMLVAYREACMALGMT
jgi:hypothetical protein